MPTTTFWAQEPRKVFRDRKSLWSRAFLELANQCDLGDNRNSRPERIVDADHNELISPVS